MLRFCVLVVMCLGLQVSCGSTDDSSLTVVALTKEPGSPAVSAALLKGTHGRLAISVPSVLVFGEQSVGAPATTLPLIVQNTGTNTVRITNITKSGPQAAAYHFTPATLDVPAGESGVVMVTFSPAWEGEAPATLTLTTDDVAMPTVLVSLMGTGVRPTLSVAASLPFGDQRVGAPGAAQTLMVANTGTGTLRIVNIITSGPGAAAYSHTPGTLDVPAGGIGALTVMFIPTVEGQADAALMLTTNDVASPIVTISLTGRGIRPRVSVAPTALDFGDVQVQGSATRTVEVSNTGTGMLSIGDISRSGTGAAFYTVSSQTLDVPEGQSRTLAVTFSPIIEGQTAVALTLSTNDVSLPTVVVALSGYGGRPTASLSLASLAFDGVRVGATRLLTVRLTNTGRAPLVIPSAPTVSPGVFSYLGPSAATLVPNDFIDFQVSFAPTSNINYSGTLTLTSNASNSPTVLRLTGFGTSPELSLNPTSIFFGGVRVGTESARLPVTLSNTGNAELVVQSLPVQGPFAVVLRAGDALPRTVAAGSSFPFEVVFRPSAEGPDSGTVSIVTDLNATPVPTVALSGTGTVARIELSAVTLDYGEQRLAHRSGVQPVMVTNRGAAELQITQIIFSNPVFTLTAPDLPTEGNPLRIAAGEQRALSVVFTPTTLGPTTGKLFITSNAFTPAPPLDLMGSGVDGQMSVTPNSVAFGSAEVGSPGVQQSVTLKNTGRYPLTIESVNAPPDTAFTVSGLPRGLVLQPDATWPFTVTFTPLRRGSFSSSAVIESDAVTNTLLNLAMAGTGVAAAVELQPQDIHFGSTHVGVALTQDLSIKNVGEKELSVSNIAFQDRDGGPVGGALDFSLDTGVTLPWVVQPGTSTLVRLKFTPQVVGQREARAIVYTNDRAAEASLVGVGISSRLQLSSPTLDFGSVLVGNPSAPRVLRITNGGAGTLTLSSLTLGGVDAASFFLTSPTLPISLPAGGDVEVAVTLRPEAARQFSALLTLESNDPEAPNATVPLVGVGVAPQLHVSKSSLEFGHQRLHVASSPRTVRVINNSGSPATLSSLVVEGVGASQFTLAMPALPLVLAHGQEQEVSVSFTPLSEAEASCTLKVVFSDPAYQLDVALRGQGLSSLISISPASLDFGRVEVDEPAGPEVITLVNTSSQEQRVEVELRDAEGTPFALEVGALANPLPPGGSTTFKVSFLPQAVGDAQNEVQVWVQGASAPEGVIPVTGTGTEPQGGCSCDSSGAGGSGLMALMLLMAALGSRLGRRAQE